MNVPARQKSWLGSVWALVVYRVPWRQPCTEMDLIEEVRKHGRERAREKRIREEDERKTVSSSEEEEEPSPRATSPSLLEAKRGRDGVPHKTLERLQVLEQRNAVLEQQVAFLYRELKLDKPGKDPPPTVAPSEPDRFEKSPPRMCAAQIATLNGFLAIDKAHRKVT